MAKKYYIKVKQLRLCGGQVITNPHMEDRDIPDVPVELDTNDKEEAMLLKHGMIALAEDDSKPAKKVKAE